MLDMIKASIRQLQHHLSEVMRYVDHGDEVLITRRNRVVAKIVPATLQPDHITWPDFAKRARAMVKIPKGAPASSVVIEDRQERA